MRPPASPRSLVLAALFVPLVLVTPSPAAAQDDLAQGDAAWSRRAEGHRGGRAQAGQVEAAIAAYERTLEQRPDDLEAAWKLLRALHFKGEYVVTTREAKQEVFGRGRDVVEKVIDVLARRAGGRKKLDAMKPGEVAKALAGAPEAPAVFLWGAVSWGLWGDAFGRVASARQGVGERIQRYGEIVVAMDERFADAGGHRLLGRLHTLAPEIPLITGWIDRDFAVSELRRAVQLAPRDPYNQLYLAEALLEHQPDKKKEALEILRRLAQQKPAAERPVEDAAPIAQAAALLAKHA